MARGRDPNVWLVAVVGAGVGLLLTAKPKRLRESVAELPASARNLVEDLTQRARGTEEAAPTGTPMPQAMSNEFEARRRERRKRRERRRQHATT